MSTDIDQVQFAQNVVSVLNSTRRNPLEVSGVLMQTAFEYAGAADAADRFDHYLLTTAQREVAFTRVAELTVWGECLLKTGQHVTAETAIGYFKASYSHWAALTNERYEWVGVFVAMDGAGNFYYVVHLGGR